MKKNNEPGKVKDGTLKKLEFFCEALVRPSKIYSHINGIMVGEIIKLPARNAGSYDDGEGWKSLMERESTFKVGDKVLYYCRVNIVLDGEPLHLVSFFAGKIIE